MIGDIVLQAQDAQRGAALSGAVEGRRDHIGNDLFRERRTVDDHRVLAAGLGHQHGVIGALRECSVDKLRDGGGTGEEHTGDARIGDQRGAHGLAASRQYLQRGFRHAGAMKEQHGRGGDQRRLLGRLGEHRIAGGERGADLPDKNGQRKIPGSDARNWAEGFRTFERTPRLPGVIAAEIRRLAYFADGIGKRFTRLARGERNERGALVFEQIRGTLETGGPVGRRNGGPRHAVRRGEIDGARHISRSGLDDAADNGASVAGIGDRHAFRGRRIRRRRRRIEWRRNTGQTTVEFPQRRFVGKIDAPRIFSVGIQRRRQRNTRMRRPTGQMRARDRIGDELRQIHVRIDDPVHERRIGAVFEKPPHEVGQQRFVRADRRIDSARAAPSVRGNDLVVQTFAHAVQALELVVAVARNRMDGGDRERIVTCELRIDCVRRGQHRFRARHVGDVGVDLARKDRVAVQPIDLRALDLGIPIGALHQPHHQAAPMPAA